jgi:hypothetical protein
MLTAFKILRDHLKQNMPSLHREPPVGAMLISTLVVYGALCAYGVSQL